MGRVICFAIATAMRQDEILRIEWADVDLQGKMVTVRDWKDPRRKDGKDQRVPLLNLPGSMHGGCCSSKKIVTRGGWSGVSSP